MPLIAVTAGAYRVYYGNDLVPLGLLDDRGVQITYSIKGHRIEKTDGYDETFINGFHTGANFRISFICQEFPIDGLSENSDTSLDATWPGLYDPDAKTWSHSRFFNQSFGFIMPTIGGEYDKFALPLLLNVEANTTAAATSFATLTALKTVPTDNQQTVINLTSKIRVLPVSLDLMPYVVESGPLAGFVTWFTVS